MSPTTWRLSSAPMPASRSAPKARFRAPARRPPDPSPADPASLGSAGGGDHRRIAQIPPLAGCSVAGHRRQCRCRRRCAAIRPVGADLTNWGPVSASSPIAASLVDPARGRVLVPGVIGAGDALFAQHYHFGLTSPVGAGPFDRAATLSPDSQVTGTLPAGPVNGDGFFTDPGPVNAVTLPTTGIQRVPSSKTYVPDTGLGQSWANVGPAHARSGRRRPPLSALRPAGCRPDHHHYCRGRRRSRRIWCWTGFGSDCSRRIWRR